MAQDRRTRKYRLGMRLHELGSMHLATLELNQKATIPLSYLARDTGLVGRLGVLERDVLVVTLDTSPLGNGSVAPYVGAAAPAYCTSMGRAILAFMPEAEAVSHLERGEACQIHAPYGGGAKGASGRTGRNQKAGLFPFQRGIFAQPGKHRRSNF